MSSNLDFYDEVAPKNYANGIQRVSIHCPEMSIAENSKRIEGISPIAVLPHPCSWAAYADARKAKETQRAHRSPVNAHHRWHHLHLPELDEQENCRVSKDPSCNFGRIRAITRQRKVIPDRNYLNTATYRLSGYSGFWKKTCMPEHSQSTRYSSRHVSYGQNYCSSAQEMERSGEEARIESHWTVASTICSSEQFSVPYRR